MKIEEAEEEAEEAEEPEETEEPVEDTTSRQLQCPRFTYSPIQSGPFTVESRQE